MCKIYIINLEDSKERFNRMKNEMQKLDLSNFEFILAIKGKELSATELNECYLRQKSLNITGREFSKGEIGCALSHQKTYQTFLNSNHNYALILEDDIELSSDTKQVIQHAGEWLNNDQPRILLLASLTAFITRSQVHLYKQYAMVKIIKSWWGMGYMLNKAAANELISINKKVWLMADDWNEYRRNTNIVIKGLDPWIIQPAPSIESTLESDRSENRIKKTRTIQYRFKKIRENILGKIIEYLILRPFAGFKTHKNKNS